MGEHVNKGFSFNGFNFQCYQCCCHVCTGRFCPHRNARYGFYRFRCAECVESNGVMPRCLECDFFQNKHTSRRHFKIRRRWHKDDEILSRLDLIMKKLEIPAGDEVTKNGSRYNYLNADVIKLIDDYNKKG